ncbi:MAG: cryptochrome DASH, partial [Cytophagaceae bacterium]
MRTLVWFRGKDLRVHDHAPLAAAAHAGEVVPVFVLDPFFFDPARAQTLPHRMQFLLESLVELQASIERLGSELLLVGGRAIDRIPELAEKLAVD